MVGSYMSGGFSARGFGGESGAGPNVADLFEQLRSMLKQHGMPRAAHGDVRAAVLALLAEKPMHGYQLMAEIEKRSGGAWKPSAGSVYPTLQLLVDEGLLAQEVADGRKTYSLTESGRAATESSTGKAAPWDTFGLHDLLGVGPLPKSVVDLAHAAAQVRRTGTSEQVDQAVAVLDDARRKLYSILAQD